MQVRWAAELRPGKSSFQRRIIVDSFFPPEKILESFREILTTSFKYSNYRRVCGGNSIARFFLP
jgi:hypothetical protein